VLERGERIGAARSRPEIAPGFRGPTLAHRAAIDRGIVSRAGPWTTWSRGDDARRTGLGARGGRTAAYPLGGHGAAVREILGVLGPRCAAVSSISVERCRGQWVLRSLIALPSARPSTVSPPAALSISLKVARKFRALAKADAHQTAAMAGRCPQPTSLANGSRANRLCSTIAAGGTLGFLLGPRSGGGVQPCCCGWQPGGRCDYSGWTVRGGIGAVSDALAGAARQAGAEIKVGAEVRQIVVQDGAATGVVLATGELVLAPPGRLERRSSSTLLGLVDSVHLPPEFVQAISQIRMRGSLAKINYAVSSLPRFGAGAPNRREQEAALSGWVRCAPAWTRSSAPSTRPSTGIRERALDRAGHPVDSRPGLAPAGQHVVSAYVQFAPYSLRRHHWDLEREHLGDVAHGHDRALRTWFRAVGGGTAVITPLDLEATYGLTGGQIFHGEVALDQLLLARPASGLGALRNADP